MPTIRHIRTLFYALGHLAIWVGFYVTGAAVCFSQVSGMAIRPLVLWVAGLTAMSVYLLDRVKVTDAWLDPADREAHPDRFVFLGNRTRAVRFLAIMLGLVAMVVATQVHWVAVSFIPLAGIGVLGYAGLPRGSRAPKSAQSSGQFARVKDVLLLKNVVVAVCITGFVGSLVLLDSLSRGRDSGIAILPNQSPGMIVTAAFFVLIIVLADAIMCDIDDADADRKHGTSTIPAQFGVRNAWLVAGALHAIAVILLLVSSDAETAHTRRLWAGLVGISFVLLAIWRPKTLRDPIDVRLAVLAIIASILIES